VQGSPRVCTWSLQRRLTIPGTERPRLLVLTFKAVVQSITHGVHLRRANWVWSDSSFLGMIVNDIEGGKRKPRKHSIFTPFFFLKAFIALISHLFDFFFWTYLPLKSSWQAHVLDNEFPILCISLSTADNWVSKPASNIMQTPILDMKPFHIWHECVSTNHDGAFPGGPFPNPPDLFSDTCSLNGRPEDQTVATKACSIKEMQTTKCAELHKLRLPSFYLCGIDI
jgi:hypothetical protein